MVGQGTVSITSAADEVRALATITTSFAGDPIVRWFIRDPASYVEHWPSFVRAFGGRSIENGFADVADDYAGVALWLPPDVGPDEEAMGAVAAVAIGRALDLYIGDRTMGPIFLGVEGGRIDR